MENGRRKLRDYPALERATLRAASENPRGCCVHELFENQAERTPDAVALVLRDCHLTYRELNRRANQLAHYLRWLGVRSDTLVGICMERSSEMIVGLMGVLKAGGACVPLDPTYPKARLAFMLEDARVPILLTQERLDRKFEHDAQVVSLDANWMDIAAEKGENLSHRVMTDNLAYVLYTSGSTGRPQGIEIEHHSVLALLHAFERVAPSREKPAGISIYPFGCDVSVWELFSVLCFGGSLHLLLPETSTDPRQLADYMITRRIASACLPAALLPPVADELERTKGPLTLRRMFVGAEPIKQSIMQRFRNLSPQMHILSGYGPTETIACATFHDFQATDNPEHRVPIGAAAPGYQVYAVDSYLRPVPIGVPGEILVGGPGLGRGYLRRSDLTAEKFVPHPFASEPGARAYRTGVLGRCHPDGNIELLGGIDHPVEARGSSVELGAIEAVLRQCPDVPDAKVVVNHEEQYSIWPADRENPRGWKDAGMSGSKQECLTFVKEVWTDTRPFSLRQKMDGAAQLQKGETKAKER